MANKDITLDYYNKEADVFFENTVSVDFSKIQEMFLKHIKPGGRILDLGCGSGRDSRAFLERGYEVVAVDGSRELAKIAGAYILHLLREEIAAVMRRMAAHLAEGGCFYASFKYGEFQGERNGRYFTDMTEESFRELLEGVPGLAIEEYFSSGDVRAGRESERWLNVMMATS